ncbi:MAG: ATP-binding protein [Herpetosiphon sp.]
MAQTHLQTLHIIARALVADAPLPERLRGMLMLLSQSIPLLGGRVIVLTPPAWSFTVPDGTAPRWPGHWTTELLRLQRPVARSTSNEAHYLGWPIAWDGELLGALELLVPPRGTGQDHLPLLDALVPLLGSAFVAPNGDGGGAQETRGAIRELQHELEAPLLLHALADTVTRWAMQHAAADHAVFHLIRSPGGQATALSTGKGKALQTAAHTEALAQSSIDRTQAMMHRNGNGLECAVPVRAAEGSVGALVVVGHRLQKKDVELLSAASSVIGPALQRALAYQQMADSHRQLEQVFADLPTGLALTGTDGRLLHANPAWARLWGIAESAVQAGQLVPWDMYKPLLPRLPDPLQFDHFFLPSGGDVKDATLTLQQPYQLLRLLRIPILDAGSDQTLTLFVLSDATLEREAERAKTEFVSVVSHELRTPLTSILGYTELLKAREFPAAERFELLDTVWKQATHLSNLVEDLLNVSRLDAGRITLNRWVLSLRQLVTELIAQMNKQLDRHRHQLLLDIDPHLPPVYADRDRLRQILSNLLSNAIKYSPGGGEIVLRAEVLVHPPSGAPPLPPEPALLITVQDPGMGIDPAEQRKIFDRFYRIDNSNTRRIGGTGLGLAITKALVELHGGRIWVTSQAGAGSTFAFTLPLAQRIVHTTRGGG